MFKHPAFRMIVMSVALTSVLVACGQQEGSNNKTIIKKSLPAPQSSSTETGKDGETTTSETPGGADDLGSSVTEAKTDKITASDSCAKPFENFAPQDGERELRIEDLLNPALVQLSADLKDKAVEFRLVSLQEWTKLENLDQKTSDELSGEFIAGEASEAHLKCHTLRVDRPATDKLETTSGLPLVVDLSTGKITKLMSLTLKAQAAETSAQAFAKDSDLDIKGTKVEAPVGGTAQLVLNRVGDKGLIMRRQVEVLSKDGKSKITSMTAGVYEAVEKAGAAAAAPAGDQAETESSED